MANKDVQYVMKLLNDFGKDYFTNQDDIDNTSMSMTGSKVAATRKGDKRGKNRENGNGNNPEDFICSFNEIPKFMFDLLEQHTKLVFERNDAKLIEFKEEIKEELKKELEEELRKEFEGKLSDLHKELRVTRNELDALAQYNRRENLNIEGVDYEEGEDVVKIIKDIGDQVGVPIQDSDISVIHRLMPNKKNDSDNSRTIPGLPISEKKIPSIIARFTRREVKSKFFEARKILTTKPDVPVKLKSAAIYENVTPLRSRIMYELRQRDDKQKFKYVWSRGGRIYCRTPEEASKTPTPRPHIINKPEDLKSVGFSDNEIEKIIKNIRT